MKQVVGIDPGQNTGTALYSNGKLVILQTIEPIDIQTFIRACAFDLIVFEDSRLQSAVWIPSASKAVANNIARKIGQVDALCSIIEDTCERYNIKYMRVSPKAKGGKMNAEDFNNLTGWTGRSNQHERDAAMVAWQLRNSNGS
jgi:hypothetical protein